MGSAVLEKFRGRQECLKSTANNFATVHKLQHNQELKPPDFDCANLVFNKMEEQYDWLPTVFWTDEAHFTPTIAEYGPQKIHMHLLRYPCNSLK
ncbi:hypothetical protein TNIN_13051 [Trichonephila inaurata madagascariensis]|uniref:Uncharacterized protein n=1 Tax=Trichonephila inaurata madagascariensis TaxID=2747483 RepID=A0A8X6IHG3_9ARAC|nr:hypothetical protein TNIN_13051 [Trichonephila inaurata madagascariensis]